MQAQDLARCADRFRDPARAREVQRGYLAAFPAGGRVLDVGCGTGGSLELLRGAGMRAVGVDASEAAVGACRAAGHDVVSGDVVDVLRQFAATGDPFDGALCVHLIEHLAGARAFELLCAIAAVLRPGSRCVVVTPNFRNAIVAHELFWLDPTHVRPYPRMLIESLAIEAGFVVRASYDDPATVPLRSRWRRCVARLRSAISGTDRSSPLDSVVVLERR